MHQNNLTSIIVDPTPSRFNKEYPNMVLKCVRRHLRISEIIGFFLNWFKIEKNNFANAPMMRYSNEKLIFYNCLIL
jgi:hypothetical protein